MRKAEVVSPMPGVFYTKPSPDSPVFKNPGDPVKIGDTIGIVEVMKTFNHILAEVDGKFIGFEVDNEEMVMVGAVLATIEVEGP